MTLRLCLLFALVFSLATALRAGESGERERTFARALEMLDHAKAPDDFRRAAAEFEAMQTDGYRNGGVFYNTGNAYMGAHDYGRAIAAYRKAKYFRPRDPYLDAILREAISIAPGHLPDAPAPWWSHVFFWTSWLSYPEKIHIAFCAWALGAALVAAGVVLRSRKAYWLSGAAVIAAIILSIDAGMSYQDVFHSRRAIVVQEIAARKGNSMDYQPAFDQPLKEGAEFTIADRRAGWVLGHFEGIGDGWLMESAIEDE